MNLENQIKLLSNKANIDADYGPYESVEVALKYIPRKYRAIGKTFAIISEDGTVTEYQFQKGISINDVVEKGGSKGPVSIIADNISDATATGKSLVKIASAAAARTLIGAGTSNLTIGTTATTAMAGNTVIPAAATWANISGKPAVVASGTDAITARASIGAGTSNLAIGTTATTALAGNTALLAIGTTASTAKPGNYTPTATEIVTAINAMTPEQVTAVQTKLGITPTP